MQYYKSKRWMAADIIAAIACEYYIQEIIE